MVFVIAREPPDVARPGIEPHHVAARHPHRTHRTEQFTLQHAAERFRGLDGDVPMGESDDLTALEELRDVLEQILELHRFERHEQDIVGPARIEQQLAHVAHRTAERGALVDVSKLAGILRLLRLEPLRREQRRAQGRYDAREQRALLVAPAGEADGDPAAVPVQRIGLPGERGGVCELVERIVRHAGEQRAQHRVPGGIVGDRRAHREVEIRARLSELDVGVMPQIEAGPAHDAGRSRPGRLRVDQRQIAGHERIRLRKHEAVVRRRVAPARHGRRRDRAQPVRRLMERCDGVGGHALPHHRHEHAVRVERGEKPPLDHGVEVVEPVGPGQDLSDRIHVQGGGERYRVGAGSALV